MNYALLALRYAWLPLVGVYVMLRSGTVGFSPTDEGFVVAQSWRVLHGEIPHVDFISPRPLGSAFIHVIDFAVPLPLLEATRLVAALQITLYSALYARFLFRRPIRDWTLFQVLGVATSVLVNIHGFPLMAWHTIDGLMLVAIGLNLVAAGLASPGRRKLLYAGMASVGAAALVKQSFAPALVAVGLWVVWAHRRQALREQVRTDGSAALAAAVPGLLYVALVALGGGLDEMVHQFRSANTEAVYGQTLIDVYDEAVTAELTVLVTLGTGAAVLLASITAFIATYARRGRSAGPQVAAVVAGVAAVVATERLVRIPMDVGYPYGHWWGVVLAWGLLGALVARSVVRRSFDWPAATVLFVGWMASLSWGYAVPHLVAGTILLATVNLLWRDIPFEWRLLRVLRIPLVGLAVAALVLTGDRVITGRHLAPYFEAPWDHLVYPLAKADENFGRVKTNRVTGAYIEDIAECVRRYPAGRVAVLPDSPGIYAYLGLRNPFPIDWMLPMEVHGSEERIRRAASALDRRGDYLVMVATTSGFVLPTFDEMPPAASSTTPIFFHHMPLGDEILQRLRGQRVTCGLFHAVYAPK